MRSPLEWWLARQWRKGPGRVPDTWPPPEFFAGARDRLADPSKPDTPEALAARLPDGGLLYLKTLREQTSDPTLLRIADEVERKRMCAFCGRTATGEAWIGDLRYCHGDNDSTPTCYEQGQYDIANGGLD